MREVIFFRPNGAKFAIGRYTVEYFSARRVVEVFDDYLNKSTTMDCPTLARFWDILDEVESLPQSITPKESIERLRKDSARQLEDVRNELNRPRASVAKKPKKK